MRNTAQKHQPLITTIYKDGGEWTYQIRRINSTFNLRKGIQIAELNKTTDPEYHARLFTASEDMLRVLQEVDQAIKGNPTKGNIEISANLKKKVSEVIKKATKGADWLKFTPKSIEGEVKKPNEN